MRIVRLESEGIKRLYAVSITPDGNVVEVTGKNGEGKSSTLDSIWYAVGGSANIPAQPIRKGAQEARIRLDMGEIIVTRKFKRKGEHEYTTSVTVENADGALFKSPQERLNALFSALTFDPLDFLRAKPKDQYDMVRVFVPDIDFQLIEDQNRGDFERRTEANKRLAEAKAAAGLIVIPNDLPDEADEAALLDQMTNAAQHNSNIERESEHRQQRAADIERALLKVGQYRDERDALRKKAEAMEAAAVALEQQIALDETSLKSAGSLAKPIDVAQVRLQHAQAQAANQRIAKAAEDQRRKSSLEKVAGDAALLSDELTNRIAARNKTKHDAIAAAKMPVEGLGFGDGYITLNDLPFDQASSAEQLKASVGIAMRTNSKLRVILIKDGSLLDADSFALLTELAEENGFQVWVESVFAHSEAALVIEDGRVRAKVNAEEEATA
jgi:hypothetical protein